MKNRIDRFSILLVMGIVMVGCAERAQEEGEQARVFFVEPVEGAEVTAPFKVVMGVEGMDVRPIADGVIEGTGHHHVLINLGPRYGPGIVIPNDEINRHYGGGQTEGELDLEPGDYRLTLQFADGKHRSYGVELSHTINITVVEGEGEGGE